MTILRNTFEGGTDTDNITVANSNGVSGPAIAVSSVTNGWQYATSAAKVGSLGARRTLDTTGAYLRWDEASPSGRGGCGRWFYVAGAVTGGPVIFQVRSVDDQLCASMTLINTGKFRAAPAGIGLSASDSPVVSTGVWYWVEMLVTPGIDDTSGRIEVTVLNADGSTFHTYDSGTTVNTKTVPPARFRMGGMNSTEAGGAWTYDLMDEIAYGSLAAGAIGPTAPASAGEDQTVEPWSLVELHATGTGTWSQTGGPTVTLDVDGADASFTAPPILGSEQEYTFAYGGDSVVVTVLPATDGLYSGSAWVPYRPYVEPAA